MNEDQYNGNLSVDIPEISCALTIPVTDFRKATPSMLSTYLQGENKLPREDPNRPYVYTAGGKQLVPGQPFASQGVAAGAEMKIQRQGIGA